MKFEISGAAHAWAAFSFSDGLAYSSIRKVKADTEAWIRGNQISHPDYEIVEIEIRPVGAIKV